MSTLLNAMSAFSFFVWNTLMRILRFLFTEAPVVEYLDTQVTAHEKELRALDQAQIQTIGKLSRSDQVLMFFSRLPFTQARAAKRRYWKLEDPLAFALLYRKLGYSVEEAEKVMREKENMPGYFRKKVRIFLYMT